ncbi:MAG TPA: hypothetical protein VFM71_13210 [Gemmatimonadaceae bacterium]|nr:hypothetical protein [Gemmatimonadaceae bacterium]
MLLMTLAVAGLSIAAIFMSSSAGLLSRFYDREREFRLAAESGIQVARSLMSRDESFALPDTGVVQVIDSMAILDADGLPIRGVWVDVYAATTGDTSGLGLPHVTLIAASRFTNGTRHVRRVDLRRESFARYALFTDSFPSGETFGPANVVGRVHSNDTWRMTSYGNTYRDTVTTVGAVTGAGAFDVDSLVGVSAVPYPADSIFAWMHTMAAAANLDVTPVSGGARGSRVEFVTVDADGDDVLEDDEGFVRVFDLAAGMDTSRLRASPPMYSAFLGVEYYRWDDVIVQNQCGAFYHTRGRWHFFPIAAHRMPYVRDVLTSPASDRYPQVNNGMMNRIEDFDFDAASEILELPTARCFPAGSPFLMSTERFTDLSGNVTGTAADTVPFGRMPPPGGWPASAPSGYGGSDTTFTPITHTCYFSASTSGTCVPGTHASLGRWRAYAGSPQVGGVPAGVRQPGELAYLWPYAPSRNAASKNVISASSGPLFVSGEVRGPVTLRVDGRAMIVDRVRFASDPNDPATPVCADRLGLLATGDVLVVDGLTSRVSKVATVILGFAVGGDAALGGAPRFTLQGNYMSLGGTVGVEHADREMGAASAQLECPDDAGSSTRSNGGCLAVTGGLTMRHFTPLHEGTYGGFRHFGARDRCQSSDQRPPFFPLTNRYTLVRTLEIEPSLANTAAKIRAILLRLKGSTL